MKILSDFVINRDNNFNLIRFVAASLVLYSHSFPLFLGRSALDPLQPLIKLSLGSIAVDVFFVISGFLILRSLLMRNNLISFAWNRILRIYPALFVSLVFCVFIVGFGFTTLDKITYLSNFEIYKFFIKNITLVFGGYGHLPNVFETTPWDKTINGSLWTLVWEIRMYGILLILGVFYSLFSWFNEKRLLLCTLIICLISLLLFITNHFFEFINHREVSQGLRLMCMFFVGSSFYALKEKILLSFKVTIAMITVLVLASCQKDLFFVLYFLFIGYIVFSLAYVPTGVITKFNKFGDYSYGIYIYAFPVQQSIVALEPDISFLEMMVLSFFITFILAFASWHFVEKKMLKKKDEYICLERYFNSIRGLSMTLTRKFK